jgi:hypothetical protein
VGEQLGGAVRLSGSQVGRTTRGSRSKLCSPRSKRTKKETRPKTKRPPIVEVTEMGIARRRVRSAAVIGPAPVARTATTVATAASKHVRSTAARPATRISET